MIVGIDARFLTHPQHGGFKSYTRTVISALASVDRANQYILYTDRPAPLPALPENFTVKTVAGVNAVVREQIALPAAMKLHGVTVAHFPCNTAPVFGGPKLVVTIHDTIPMERGRSNGDRMKQRLLFSYWRTVIPRGAQRAALAITSSRHTLIDLRLRLDLPTFRVRVIPIAIDEVFLCGSPGSPPAGIEPGAEFLLAFGAPDGRKNHVGVIEAFRALEADYPGIRLVIVCSHSTVCDSLPGDGRIVALYPVSTQELVWLYRNALALVFPSFGEGFGLPPLEAMACGTSVVASGAGSLPEVLGDVAVRVDPHQVESIARGIRLVLEDTALREDMSRRGLEHASQFSLEAMGRKLISTYIEAAAARRQPEAFP